MLSESAGLEHREANAAWSIRCCIMYKQLLHHDEAKEEAWGIGCSAVRHFLSFQ